MSRLDARRIFADMVNDQGAIDRPDEHGVGGDVRPSSHGDLLIGVWVPGVSPELETTAGHPLGSGQQVLAEAFDGEMLRKALHIRLHPPLLSRRSDNSPP